MKKIQLVLENESKTKTDLIEWGLYDTHSVDKVFNLLEYTKPASKLYGRIDVRQKQSDQTTLTLAEEMNWVIDEVNAECDGCEIDLALKLDLAVAPHEQVKKLNTLHEIFQLYSEQHGTGVNRTQELLERVNILVHMLEGGPVEIDQVFMVAKQECAKATELDIDFTDDDHLLRMPHALWGVLEMDYHTIGKDLGACYWTNDTELVASGELRQQTQLTPCVAANFMTAPHMGPTPEVDAQKIKDYYDWCESNNLKDYIDYMAPEYRLGRLRLGELVETYDIGQIQTMAIEFPTIKEIITIDDK